MVSDMFDAYQQQQAAYRQQQAIMYNNQLGRHVWSGLAAMREQASSKKAKPANFIDELREEVKDWLKDVF